MWRATRNLFLLAVLALFIAWVVQDPGAIRLEWRGYEVRASLFVAVAAVIVAFALLMLLTRLFASGLALPRHIRERRRRNRLQEACRLFCDALAADAAQDKAQAITLARKASERMEGEVERDLALALTLRIAESSGDDDAIREQANKMLSHPEVEFPAVRALFQQAQKRNDPLGALEYARRALALRKGTAWAAQAVFENAAARKQWREALDALAVAARAQAFPEAQAKRSRALLLCALAQEAEREARHTDAWKHAQEAIDLLPDFPPLVALAARLSARIGKPRRGAKLIETAWRRAPHPQLADAWTRLFENEPPSEAAKRMAELAQHAPQHAESRIILAGSRLQTREYSIAHSLLQPLTENEPVERRVCLLMAQAEKGMGNRAAAEAWSIRAEAAPSPRWHCRGYETDVWQPVCPACDAFDALEWGIPAPRAAHGATPSAPLPPKESRQAGGEDKTKAAPPPTLDAPRNQRHPPVRAAATFATPDDPGPANPRNRRGNEDTSI